MTKFSVSKKSILEASLELKQEIKDAFKTAVPPICIEMGCRDDVEAFAMLFETALHAYRGKRISCKNAKSYAPSSYSAEELWMLEKDKYPVELFFKSAEDIEDFAEGYLNAAATITRQQEKAQIQKMAEEREEPRKVKKTIHDKYDVNPFAETFLDTILKIVLIVGWVLAIGIIVVSVFIANDAGESYIIILGVLGAAFLLLSYYSVWAINKVIINMSRSLYNINERLKDSE